MRLSTIALGVGTGCALRSAVALVAALLVAAAIAPAAQSAARLPPGWSFERHELVWSSSTPLRMGGARYEFRSGDQLLGYPQQRGDTLRLKWTGSTPLADLSVWAGGRRIDAPSSRPRDLADRSDADSELAEAAAEVAVADPGRRGPYAARRFRYQLPALAVEDYPAPLEVLAEATAPIGAPGARPLVLMLHGRHSTCYRGGPNGNASGDWPCPPGWRAVPSYTGYRYIADVLATQGYVVVSIAANGVNAQDGLNLDGGASARSRLVRHHLALWSEWGSVGGDPWGGRFLGRVNMDDVVLVGHSRGGEGVERAAIDTDADDPWQIRGLVLIGPTAFGRQVAPGVHTTVILPFCDGDVTSLEGQQYVDIGRDLTVDRALRTSVIAMGTNHNYYNTEWTPGLSKSPAWDDWFDPEDRQCGEKGDRRLSPSEQQAVGLAYTAALVDVALAKDLASLPLLDGTPVRPQSIGRARTHVHAIEGGKRVLYAAGAGTSVSASGLEARECRGYHLAGPFDLRAGCTPDLFFEALPHWQPMSFAETAPAPRALELRWEHSGGTVRIPVSANLSGADALDFRIAGEPGARPVQFRVRIGDALGRVADLPVDPAVLRSYGGPNPLGKVVARQLRASLRGVTVDLGAITSIELIPATARGRVWLLDVSSRLERLPAIGAMHLPRVSAGDVTIAEGDAGAMTIDVPISIEGTVRRPARLWVQLTDPANLTQPSSGFSLLLAPGTTSATVPVTYHADDAFNPFEQRIMVTLLARRHAVTGDFDAAVVIEEDDPAPRLTVDAKQVAAAEGAALKWTFRLSEPMAGSAFWSVRLVAADGRFTELDSDDVPRSFLESYGIDPPVPAVPLADLGIFLSVEFAPGTRETTLAIPIDRDLKSEPREGVALRLEGFGDPVVPRPINLTGFVPAH